MVLSARSGHSIASETMPRTTEKIASDIFALGAHDSDRDVMAGRSKASLALMSICLLMAGCEKYALDRQMEDLCRQDGGVKIYETIALDPEEFDKDGVPMGRFWSDRKLAGSVGRLGPSYRYETHQKVIKDGNPLKGSGRLTRFTQEIFRVNDGKLLGRSVWYGRAGGDFIVLGHWSTSGCPDAGPSLLSGVFARREQR